MRGEKIFLGQYETMVQQIKTMADHQRHVNYWETLMLAVIN